MWNLPDREFIARLQKLNGTPPAVLANDEIMSLTLPVLRADFAVSETYVYSPREPLACPISAFGGSRDTEVSHADLEAWRVHTRSKFLLRACPGDHFFLHDNRDAILSAIGKDLAGLSMSS